MMKFEISRRLYFLRSEIFLNSEKIFGRRAEKRKKPDEDTEVFPENFLK